MLGVLFVHTVTLTLDDVELCARFYHSYHSNLLKSTLPIALFGKCIAVKFNKQKGLCRPLKHRNNQHRLHHNIHTIFIKGFHSSNTSPAREKSVPEIVTSALSNAGQQKNLSEQDMIQDFTSSALQIYDTSLPYDATAQQTSTWLQTNRFSVHLRTFSSYSGADLLRLSRDDLIQICGLADGIRLFNALHTKAKTLYMCIQSSPTVYHAIYLANLSSREMKTKVAILLGFTTGHIQNIYMLGPSGIHVMISDELVLNIKDGATYAIEMMQDSPPDQVNVLLKPSTN